MVMTNAFCPTGPGGGQDNSCSPTGGRAVTKTPEFKRWFGDSKVVDEKDEVLFISTSGTVIRSKVAVIRETGRSAQGVRIMRMLETVTIAGVAVVVTQEEVSDDVEAAT